MLSGVLGTGLDLTFASSGVMSIWDRFMGILGLFGGSMCGLFCLGILTTRANGPGAVVGALAGAAGLYWVQRHTPTHSLLYAFIGVSLCFVTGYLASFAFPPARKSIRGLTIYTLRDADGTEATPSEKRNP